MKHTIAWLLDCSEYDKVYGILKVYNHTLKEIQNEINSIKEELDKDNIDWHISDVLDSLPSDWKWEYIVPSEALYI